MISEWPCIRDTQVWVGTVSLSQHPAKLPLLCPQQCTPRWTDPFPHKSWQLLQLGCLCLSSLELQCQTPKPRLFSRKQWMLWSIALLSILMDTDGVITLNIYMHVVNKNFFVMQFFLSYVWFHCSILTNHAKGKRFFKALPLIFLETITWYLVAGL